MLAFHTAVSEKAEMHNMSMESAAYRVIEDIRDYNKLSGIKKQFYDVSTKVFVMNQFSARQNNAVMALIKLQSQGVTEDRQRLLEEYGHGMQSGFKRVQSAPYIFKR